MKSIFKLVLLLFCQVPAPHLNMRPIPPIIYEASIRRQVEQNHAEHMVSRVYRVYDCPTRLVAPTAEAALAARINPQILAAIVVVESSCKTNAISKAGAIGLTQVMPKIHRVSRQALLRPTKNLQVGALILSENIRVLGLRNGLKAYFGNFDGADDYADHVLKIARF